MKALTLSNFLRKTFLPLTVQKSFPYNCCPNNCLFLTYFAVYYARQAYAETLAFGIANPDPSGAKALLLWEASQISLVAFLSFAKSLDFLKWNRI